MDEIPHIQRRSFIFGYSLILPATWLGFGLLMRPLVPGLRFGIVGTALMFMGVAALTSWFFVRRHLRDYTSKEYWNLIIYSSIWATLIESLVLFTQVLEPQVKTGHVDTGPLVFAIIIAIVVDFLLLWGAYWKTGRRVIAWHIQKDGRNNAAPPTPASG